MDQTPGKESTTPTKRYKGEGRVSFLANLDSIRKGVDEGWPLQAIYDRHKDRLNIQYMQFHRYVRKYITGEPSQKKNSTGIDQSEFSKAKISVPKEHPKKNLNDATPLDDSELF